MSGLEKEKKDFEVRSGERDSKLAKAEKKFPDQYDKNFVGNSKN